MEEQLMRLAIEEAKKAPHPYAALLVKDGKVIAKAGTSSADSLDPTAHAEMSVIREACVKLHTNNLTGLSLYTTVEPCPMCFSASWWANISKIYFGISLTESSKLLFAEMDVTSHYLNKHSGNKIELVGGVLSEEIRKLFNNLKK